MGIHFNFRPSESAPKSPLGSMRSGKSKGRLHFHEPGMYKVGEDKYAVTAKRVFQKGNSPPKLNFIEKRLYILQEGDKEKGEWFKINKYSLKHRFGFSGKELNKAMKDNALITLLRKGLESNKKSDVENEIDKLLSIKNIPDLIQAIESLPPYLLQATAKRLVPVMNEDRLNDLMMELRKEQSKTYKEMYGACMSWAKNSKSFRKEWKRMKSEIEEIGEREAKEAAQKEKAAAAERKKELLHTLSTFNWEIPTSPPPPYGRLNTAMNATLDDSMLDFQGMSDEEYGKLLRHTSDLANRRDLSEETVQKMGSNVIARLAVIALDSKVPRLDIKYREGDQARVNYWLHEMFSKVANTAKPEVTAKIFASILTRLSHHLQNDLMLEGKSDPSSLNPFVKSVKEGLERMLDNAGLDEKKLAKVRTHLEKELSKDRPIKQLLEAAFLLPHATQENFAKMLDGARLDIRGVVVQFLPQELQTQAQKLAR
jgi:hypothetical protein